MTVVHRATRAAGTAIPGDVKSTPLVVLDGRRRRRHHGVLHCQRPPARYAYRPGDAEASVAPAGPRGGRLPHGHGAPRPDGHLYHQRLRSPFAVTPGTVPPSGPGTGEEEKPGGNGGGSGDRVCRAVRARRRCGRRPGRSRVPGRRPARPVRQGAP
ncbi:MAG: hypothetical protein ACLSGS_03910 [Adlercreutzia sp.]